MCYLDVDIVYNDSYRLLARPLILHTVFQYMNGKWTQVLPTETFENDAHPSLEKGYNELSNPQFQRFIALGE